MITLILQFLLSAGLVFYSARLLAQSSDTIATSTRLGHFFVGTFLLAASTSLPEFFVDIRATIADTPDLAAGDLLGSSLVNLSIFAIATLLYRSHLPSRLPKMTKPILLAIVLTGIVILSIYFPDFHLLLFGISTGSLVIVILYLGGIRFLFEKEPKDSHFKKEDNTKKLTGAIVRFAFATGILFFSSPWIIASVTKLSELWGLDHSFVGASLLALTTSLPELVSSIVAARLGLFDLILGNIVGSNSLNMIIFFFMDWIWKKGSIWSHLSKKHVIAGGFVIFNMTLLLILNLSKKNDQKKKMIFNAAIILLSSLVSYGLLFYFK